MLSQYCWGSAAWGEWDDIACKISWGLFWQDALRHLFSFEYFDSNFVPSFLLEWNDVTYILRVKPYVRVESSVSARSQEGASYGCSVFQTKRRCLWKQGWMDQWMILLQWRDQKSLKFVNRFNKSNCFSNKLQCIKALKVNSDFWADYNSSQQKTFKNILHLKDRKKQSWPLLLINSRLRYSELPFSSSD